MAEISNTDLRTTIRYLRDATKIYAPSGQSKMANRARLINKLINKLKNKLPNDKK